MIAVAADHAGFDYKQQIRRWLIAHGWEVCDFGTDSQTPVDYPDYVVPAAQCVSRGECRLGIVVGGSGNGEAIAANKVKGIRCAVCWNEYTARMARAHNDANMISIGQRTVDIKTALAIVQNWLDTPFEGERHVRRITLIHEQETL